MDTNITQLSTEAGEGDKQAVEQLFIVLYNELRESAARLLRRESAGHTLQPTALVHEVFEKLVDPDELNLNGQTHFRAVAARAMKQVLIDHARAKGSQKRGGSWRKVALDYASSTGQPDHSVMEVDIHQLYEALEKMRTLDPHMADLVTLRILSGMNTKTIAEVLGMSTRSVEREWSMGRAWLRRELSEDTEHDQS
jgi:RNA polymerase sigma-70 factor (ECF subfamily)